MTNSIENQCAAAKRAAADIAGISTAQKNVALRNMSDALLQNQSAILEANKCDIQLAEKAGLTTTLVDRLSLNPSRIRAMAEGLITLEAMRDPVGEVMGGWTQPNGLKISKVRVPFGVIGMIYEARPNVTVDAAGLAIKSGNCVVLRGSSSAQHSNRTLTKVLQQSLVAASLPATCIQLLEDTSHEGVIQLIKMNRYLDLVIPRGGAGLIENVVRNATVPAIETGIGNCHVFVDASAKQENALKICINAKVQRPSVCNACETILIHKDIATSFLPILASELEKHRVEIRGCSRTKLLWSNSTLADESDWATEFLDLVVAIKIVDSVEDAISHIQKFGTKHSEAILSENFSVIQSFTQRVDAAAVLVNASTRFVDGGEFGFGAEMGISTQKMHARGPMGLTELTTYKYLVEGNGQIRP